MRRPFSRWLLLLLAAVSVPTIAADTRLAESVVIADTLDDDLYAAGGEVRIDGQVAGSAVLAAGTAELNGDVGGDVLLAAGRVVIAGGVGDDLRVAGGDVQLLGFVTDQANIAGGTVVIGPGSAIGGRAWIAGGDIEMAGQVGGSLDLAAGTVVISGRIAGDVEIVAREIRIDPGAVIAGDLVIRSDNPPLIAEDAQILGNVIAGEVGEPTDEAPDDGGDGWAAGVAVAVASLMLLWLAPGLADRGAAAFRRAPGRIFLLGVATLVLTPVVILILFGTVLGWLLALVVLAGYGFALLLSGLVGLVALAVLVRRRFGDAPAGAGGWRTALLLLVVAAVLVLAQRVPVLGSLLVGLLMTGGLGILATLVSGRAGSADGRT